VLQAGEALGEVSSVENLKVPGAYLIHRRDAVANPSPRAISASSRNNGAPQPGATRVLIDPKKSGCCKEKTVPGSTARSLFPQIPTYPREQLHPVYFAFPPDTSAGEKNDTFNLELRIGT
jgi:hypothetical protein